MAPLADLLPLRGHWQQARAMSCNRLPGHVSPLLLEATCVYTNVYTWLKFSSYAVFCSLPPLMLHWYNTSSIWSILFQTVIAGV